MTKNHERINELFEELVPGSGKAETRWASATAGRPATRQPAS